MTDTDAQQNNNIVINIPENDDLKKNNRKKGFRKRLFEIIELAESGDIVSSIYDIFMITTIVVSLVPLAFKENYTAFYYMDIVVVGIFIFDYFLRFITADYKLNKKSIISFIRYPFTLWAIIDLLSILPSLTVIYDSLKLLRVVNLIKTLRIIRALKAFKYNKNIFIIVDVIKKSKKPLTAVCTLALGYVLVSALVIFNVEGDSFDSFFSAVYWATVSLTTVGYGDLYPITVEGRIVAMISSVFGIALVALPAGVITAGYMESLNSIVEQKIVSSSIMNDNNKNE